jgi:hypothetical protein
MLAGVRLPSQKTIPTSCSTARETKRAGKTLSPPWISSRLHRDSQKALAAYGGRAAGPNRGPCATLLPTAFATLLPTAFRLLPTR